MILKMAIALPNLEYPIKYPQPIALQNLQFNIMGQAKHYHSQSDPNCTQFSNLSPAAARTQHSRLVIRELFAAFAPEFKTLILTRTFPDDYQQTCTFVTNWLSHRLIRYRQGDREYIARFILSAIAQLDDFSVIDQHQ